MLIRNYSGGSRTSRNSGYDNYASLHKYASSEETGTYNNEEINYQYKPKYSDYYPGRNDYNKNLNNLNDERFDCDNDYSSNNGK